MFYKVWSGKKNCYEWVVNPTVQTSVEFVEKSVADFSNWSPNLDNVKQLQLALSGTNNIKKYDYQDGVDTNSSDYLLRNKGLDITEREAILRGIFNRNQEEAQSNFDSEIEKLKQESTADSSSDSSESQSK